MLRKIVFVHSPIQYLLAQELISASVLGDDCLFVFHRGQKPLASFTAPHLVSDHYLLNDNVFLTTLLGSHDGVDEVVLPHALCLAYEIAVHHPGIQRISYLEEGTGTLYALKNPSYGQAIAKPPLSWRERLGILAGCARRLGVRRLPLILANLRVEAGFRARKAGLFLEYGQKPGTTYGLAAWAGPSATYRAVPLSAQVPAPLSRKVLFAIGKAEMKIPGYWAFLNRLSTELAAHDITSIIKLHPSLKPKSFKGKDPDRAAFLARASEFPPQEDELGFAIVKQGYLGAVSFFSSFQVYAHILGRDMNRPFPMLSLEKLLGSDDFAHKAAQLPDCGLEENICLEPDTWLRQVLTQAQDPR